MKLHPLVGHEQTRASLVAAHARGPLPASLLLKGPRGVGKGRTALWIAQLTVCEEPGADGPCDTCRTCRMALALEHPDVHLYFPLPRPRGVSGDRLGDKLEEARIEGIAELKEQPLRPSLSDELQGIYLAQIQSLRRRAHMRPTMASVQTFVLLDAELLVPQEASPEAANALLKLLEEPPSGTRLILTASEPGRLLPTIRSRAVPLNLGPLHTAAVAEFLVSLADTDPDSAAWAAELGQGSIGRALGFLPEADEPGALEQLRRKGLSLVEASISDDRGRGFEAALGFPPAGARRLVELFGFVESWLRDLAAVAAGADVRVVNRDELERLRRLVEAVPLDPADLSGMLPAVEEARELARGNVNPQLIMSGMLRKLRAGLRPQRAAVAS